MARIFVVVEIAVFFPNKGHPEVAISVQIGKGGGAASPNINAIEGVGGSLFAPRKRDCCYCLYFCSN
jgi:hypothetical protein